MSSSERVQLSIRVPSDMLDKFERIATALERDRTWVMLQAFQMYLDCEGQVILNDAEGLAALDRGDSVDWETAMTRIDAAIARGAAASGIKKAG